MKNITRTLFIVLLFVVTSSSAYSEDFLKWRDYDKGDYARETVFAVAMYTDYSQTMQISSACDGKIGCDIHETNSILGRHPCDARIGNYFVAAFAAHAVITGLLPREYRPAWQYGWIAAEALTILKNRKIGLHVQF